MSQCCFRLLHCLLFAAALVLVPVPLGMANEAADDSDDAPVPGFMRAIVATAGASELHSPSDIAIDQQGHLLVTDFKRNTVLRITPAGAITVLAGDPKVDVTVVGGSRDGLGAEATFMTPMGVAIGPAGNIFIANMDDQNIRQLTPAGRVTTFAGQVPVPGEAPTSQHRDGARLLAEFYHPQGIASDRSGNLYVADSANNNIRQITPAGQVTTLAGCSAPVGCPPGHRDGAAGSAKFHAPQAIAVDHLGSVYVADTGSHTIRKIAAGAVTTLAGKPDLTGHADGLGAAARFHGPQGIAVDRAGNVFVSDTDNSMIRRISPAGVVATVAGVPEALNEDDVSLADGKGSAARFSQPLGIELDAAGNLYVADAGNHAIRKITPQGAVSTVVNSIILLD